MALFRSWSVAFWCLLPGSYAHGGNLDHKSAVYVPFVIQSGVEVARNSTGRQPAILSLVCSSRGHIHLLLRTRLPIPEGYRDNIVGRDDHVSLFVGEGIKQEFSIVVDVVAHGRNRPRSIYEWLSGIDDPDTVVTPQLSMAQIDTLADWFGDAPPSKVSVVGILETGVFLVGTRAGDAIRGLQKSCVASPA